VFAPRALTRAIERIVGGEMNERHPAPSRPTRDDSRRFRLDLVREIRLVFSLVDRRKRGGVNNGGPSSRGLLRLVRRC
jgi:hypothetical protein